MTQTYLQEFAGIIQSEFFGKHENFLPPRGEPRQTRVLSQFETVILSVAKNLLSEQKLPGEKTLRCAQGDNIFL